jgi:Flp pilus assembly protein TadD/peroxiredoxin
MRATVRWPNGLTQQFDNLPVDHRVELEEGSPSFVAKPFAAPPASWSHAGAPAPLEPLPAQVETWLIEPLKAPEFSLPDLAGNQHDLRESGGSFVLLNFWATTSAVCRPQLRLLEQHRSEMAANRLHILAVNVDDASALASVHSLAAQERLTFPVLIATLEVAGIYNIIYRYLFDRRRDLAIPTSFLLDNAGMIVKVCQGPLDPQRLIEDARSIPVDARDPLQKAIPFHGKLYQGAFQRNDFTYGVALFQHGYFAQAEESFQQVIAVKPDDPDAYYNLGTLNLRRDNIEQAREYLEQSLKLRPNYPEAWNNLGMIAAQQGQPDEAIRDFQQSLALRPTYAIALLNLGNVYRRQRDFDRAQQSLSQALALQPDDPEVNYSYGMLYAQQGQMQQAVEYLRKAIDLRPGYPEALNNLGVLYVRTQDYSKAEEQFRTCIRLVPAFDQSYLNLASLYAMRNDTEQAKGILEELLRIQPGNPAANQALQLLQSPR